MDQNKEERLNGDSIKKEVIIKEIHQWRRPDGKYARSENPKRNETTIHLSFEIKNKLEALREVDGESYRSIISRLIKEHYILGLLKEKLYKKGENQNGANQNGVNQNGANQKGDMPSSG